MGSSPTVRGSWFHTPSKNYSCTNKTRNLCDTLAVVLASTQYSSGALYSAGSSSPSASRGELALPLQNNKKVLRFLNSILNF